MTLPVPPPITDRDEAIRNSLLDVEYINLEVSGCGSSLVFNASKKGLEAFLKLYADLETPPKNISLQKWMRPQRVWKSYEIRDNPKALPTDPSPYWARFQNEQPNILHPFLNIHLLDEHHNEPILAAGVQNEAIFLIVNKQGWQKFLEMLRCLLHKSYWFYVTIPNNSSWNHLPFLLTTPYPGDPQDHVFKTIECIRLEPESYIFLNARFTTDISEKDQTPLIGGSIGGNSAGLLLLSRWLGDFAESTDSSQDILNEWYDIFKSVRYGQSRSFAEEPPFWFHFFKVRQDLPHPVLAFGAKIDGTRDVYIFGNSKGFDELSRLMETSAFDGSHDSFPASQDLRHRWPGDITRQLVVPEGIHLFCSWHLYEGGWYNHAYYPLVKYKWMPETPKEILEEIDLKFVNDRIVRGNNC